VLLNAAVYRRGLGSSTDFETREWSHDHYHRLRERDVRGDPAQSPTGSPAGMLNCR